MCQVENDVKKRDLLQLLEKYENTNELALATTAGMGFIVRMWVKQGESRVRIQVPTRV